jgi:hypothetical protein
MVRKCHVHITYSAQIINKVGFQIARLCYLIMFFFPAPEKNILKKLTKKIAFMK